MFGNKPRCPFSLQMHLILANNLVQDLSKKMSLDESTQPNPNTLFIINTASPYIISHFVQFSPRLQAQKGKNPVQALHKSKN